MDPIIGRKDELRSFEAAYNSDSAELITVTGRRRVGKTFLVWRYFGDKDDCLYFSVTGIREDNMEQQLINFTKRVALAFYRKETSLKVPKNWYDALDLLAREIADSEQKKIVLFFDEFPWMATHKSELLSAFEYFCTLKFCCAWDTNLSGAQQGFLVSVVLRINFSAKKVNLIGSKGKCSMALFCRGMEGVWWFL